MGIGKEERKASEELEESKEHGPANEMGVGRTPSGRFGSCYELERRNWTRRKMSEGYDDAGKGVEG